MRALSDRARVPVSAHSNRRLTFLGQGFQKLALAQCTTSEAILEDAQSRESIMIAVRSFGDRFSI
jgi:hypothetical protein